MVAPKETVVKEKCCVVFDTVKVETRLKLHCVPFHLLDALIREALQSYGKVEDMTRET